MRPEFVDNRNGSTLVGDLYGLNESQFRDIFETFHEGWDYHARLHAVLRFLRQYGG